MTDESESGSDENRIATLRELGVTSVRWIAALDPDTCPECLRLDGTVFSLDETLPKPHSACRCTVIPDMGELGGTRASNWGQVTGEESTIVTGVLARMWVARKRLVDDVMAFLVASDQANRTLAANLMTDVLGEVGAKPSKEATLLILEHGHQSAFHGVDSVVVAAASFDLLDLLTAWLERITAFHSAGPNYWLDAADALFHDAAAGVAGTGDAQITFCKRAETLAQGNCSQLLKVARAYVRCGQHQSAHRAAQNALASNPTSKAAQKLVLKFAPQADS
jgi:hypothetical protein